MEFWTLLGIVSVVYVFYVFISELGKSLPIMELMLLIAGLQWIIGPVIEYLNPSFHYKYYMYVPEDEYMSFVVPGYLVFTVIVLYILKKSSKFYVPLENLNLYSNIGLYLVAFGFFADIFLEFLGFFGFLLGNFKYVGALILYFSPNKSYRKVFYVVIALLLFRALSNAMFHDFILWSVFFYMFFTYKYKPTMQTKLLTIVAAVVLASSLQTVKVAYRSQVWTGYSGNKVELFIGLMYNNLTGQGVTLEETNKNKDINNNVRLNQGWIISAVMKNIPNKQPFLEGGTVLDALQSSLLPRFIDSEKAKAGGRENFRKFTGLYLNDGTSMGISIIGEAYGNYGFFGGLIFMGIWGWFIVQVWFILIKKSRNQIILLAFFPLIFLQVVKAETELVVVLNHLIKATLVVYLFFWVGKEFFNWNFRLSPSRLTL